LSVYSVSLPAIPWGGHVAAPLSRVMN
jgi:hypothetical protein